VRTLAARGHEHLRLERDSAKRPLLHWGGGSPEFLQIAGTRAVEAISLKVLENEPESRTAWRMTQSAANPFSTVKSLLSREITGNFLVFEPFLDLGQSIRLWKGRTFS
jgi:hypothetical protein